MGPESGGQAWLWSVLGWLLPMGPVCRAGRETPFACEETLPQSGWWLGRGHTPSPGLSRRAAASAGGTGAWGAVSVLLTACTACLARRPADCLLMLAYKDKAERAKGLRERSSLMLEDICGLEPGLPYEGLAHTLAIICLSQAVMLGFDSREAMCAWDARIRYALGEGE